MLAFAQDEAHRVKTAVHGSLLGEGDSVEFEGDVGSGGFSWLMVRVATLRWEHLTNV